ncbi:hypothetical protein TREMEDRAFT_57265 [Tremella mesenterica DSM 1558]|nr:uncharacterized protein TREMEDRAFT_57265 [Tremella mesenterica DSM 1558]EIW68269.1 hypothetical protein TREMEDRAFT_57265 [Tremella mesenterica DSM 1558]
MKRRTTDDDEVIRWPELNRHGDSDAHHALPARQTGQHGIETSPLERSISNSSSIFTPSAAAHSAAPMALNGSSFGAGPSLENYAHEQSPSSGHSDSPDLRPMSGYENDDAYDYSSFPPPVQMHVQPSGAGGAYDSDEEGHSPMSSQEGRMVMSQLPGPGHVTYGTH